jgi:Polyketide cyclase / dehydrase and lipid transport
MPAFSSTRTILVDAPPSSILPLLADFRAWVQWSPWEGLDPDLQRTYIGEGVGASYAWSGNNKAGQGSMTMTGIAPDRVDVDLVFEKPFKATNQVVFELEPRGEQTEVAWSMTGERNVVFALMGKLYFDKAIRKDFDKGLAALKSAVEQT